MLQSLFLNIPISTYFVINLCALFSKFFFHIFSTNKKFLRKHDFGRKLEGGTGLQGVSSNLNLCIHSLPTQFFSSYCSLFNICPTRLKVPNTVNNRGRTPRVWAYKRSVANSSVNVRFVLTKWEAPIGPFYQMRSPHWLIWSKRNEQWLMNWLLAILICHSSKGIDRESMGKGNAERARVLKESAKDFCKNTSVHGFTYWVSPGEKYRVVKKYSCCYENCPDKIPAPA